MFPKSVLIAVSVAALSACGTAQPQPPLRGAPDSSTGVQLDTRVIALDDCVLGPVGPQAAPLLGAIGAILAGQLVTSAVTSIGEGLNEAGKEKTYQISATRNLALAQDQKAPCLYFIRGRFHTNPTSARDVAVTDIRIPRYTDTAKVAFLNQGLWLADTPDLVIELAPVRNQGFLAFEVGYLWYGASIASSHDADSGIVTILEMSLRPPGVPHNDEKAPAMQIQLGNLSAPASFSPPGDPGLSQSLSRPLQTPWMKIDSSAIDGDRILVTADIRVAETVPTNPILTTLGSALSGAAKDTGGAVKAALDPATRAAAEATAFQTQKGAITEYWKAAADAETAIAACRAAAPEDLKAEATAARGAQELANFLASKVGKAPPYTDLIDPSASTPC